MLRCIEDECLLRCFENLRDLKTHYNIRHSTQYSEASESYLATSYENTQLTNQNKNILVSLNPSSWNPLRVEPEEPKPLDAVETLPSTSSSTEVSPSNKSESSTPDKKKIRLDEERRLKNELNNVVFSALSDIAKKKDVNCEEEAEWTQRAIVNLPSKNYVYKVEASTDHLILCTEIMTTGLKVMPYLLSLGQDIKQFLEVFSPEKTIGVQICAFSRWVATPNRTRSNLLNLSVLLKEERHWSNLKIMGSRFQTSRIYNDMAYESKLEMDAHKKANDWMSLHSLFGVGIRIWTLARNFDQSRAPFFSLQKADDTCCREHPKQYLHIFKTSMEKYVDFREILSSRRHNITNILELHVKVYPETFVEFSVILCYERVNGRNVFELRTLGLIFTIEDPTDAIIDFVIDELCIQNKEREKAKNTPLYFVSEIQIKIIKESAEVLAARNAQVFFGDKCGFCLRNKLEKKCPVCKK